MDIGEPCDRHRHTSPRPSGEHHCKHSRDDWDCSIGQWSPKQAAHGSSNPSRQRTAGVFTDTIAALWQRLGTKCHAPAEKRRPSEPDDAADTLLRKADKPVWRDKCSTVALLSSTARSLYAGEKR